MQYCVPDSAFIMTKIYRPHVFAIGTLGVQQRQALRAQRWSFSGTESLLEGYVQLRQRLAAGQRKHSLVVLVDLHASDPDVRECTAPLVVASVAGQISRGELRPAWLVGVSADGTTDLEVEARVAGFHHTVRVPLEGLAYQTLADMAARPAPIPQQASHPEARVAVLAYQQAAQRILDAALAAKSRLWTAEDVQAVLSWLTRYPALPDSALQQTAAQNQRLLRALGGPRAASQRLMAIAIQWQERYPLHSKILSQFLQGYERREIVKYFVEQGLYEDSRIYGCIKELPARIAAQLRVEQITAEQLDPD
jgi:hypothetical protein